jgi:formylglycine-generating enzyme required for sulfatase activity
MKKISVSLLFILYAGSVCGQDKDKNLTFTVNGIQFEMVFVDSGTFLMGCSNEKKDCYNNEMPAHKVTLSNFYYIGKYEVTQKLWYAVMKNTIQQQHKLASAVSVFGEGGDLPMYYINYNECIEFCGKLNKLLSNQLPKGYKFRIPTEAQWEYAARGGKKSNGYKYSGSDSIGEVAWYDRNSGNKTHEVGIKTANELGIYDMSGNIGEWCQDGMNGYLNTPETNPKNLSTDFVYVFRGGSFSHDMTSCRVYYRRSAGGSIRYGNIGLRICLSTY